MRVGFAGIGAMGWPMAANIARKGFDLTVFDLDPARRERFAAEFGAAAASSIAELAALDVVITMLPTGAHVREALVEQDGGAFLRTARPGLIVVDMSSSEPGGTRALGEILGGHGITLIDAPVSGAVPRAEAGTIAIMIGGADEASIARVELLMLAMGNRLFRTGDLGSGHATKALNNFLAGAGQAAAAEALIIARRFGLDPKTLLDVINVSTGKNFATEMLFEQHVLSGKFASGFSIGLLAKDMAIAEGLAHELGVHAPLLTVATGRFAEARDRLGAGSDNSAFITAWEDQFGKA